jgi:hypothetical protein
MVMLRDMVAVDSRSVRLRHQLQPLFVLLRQIAIVTPLQMVKNPELHLTTLRRPVLLQLYVERFLSNG